MPDTGLLRVYRLHQMRCRLFRFSWRYLLAAPAAISHPRIMPLSNSRRSAGHFLGVAAVVLLLLLVLQERIVHLSPAASGNFMVLCFFAALFLSLAAGWMTSRWWLVLSAILFAAYLFIAIGEAFWEWHATGH
jgi:hypothetical protein